MKEEQIEGLLQSAYETVPYYNHIFNGLEDGVEFEEIPYLTRDIIYEYGAVNFLSEECREVINSDSEKRERLYRVERTSGTTREPLRVIWNRQEYLFSIKHHWKLRRKFGILPESKGLIEERNSARNSSVRIRDERLIWNIDSITEEGMNKLMDELEDFRPEWLCLSASRIFLLLRYLKQKGKRMPDSIRYIEFMGEPLLDYYREYIEREICVKTANMYGCVETNGIAFECEHRNLHLMEDNVYAEIVDGKRVLGYGEVGNVCVTGLYNRTMPFLRYRLNDRGCMKESKCACGNKSPILELKNVRLPNLLFFADSEVYDKAELLYPANNVDIIPASENSVFFSIHLCKEKILEQYVIEFEGVAEEDRKGVETAFEQLLGTFGIQDIGFEFTYSEKINKEIQYGFINIRS